jgi:hypothetical protein
LALFLAYRYASIKAETTATRQYSPAPEVLAALSPRTIRVPIIQALGSLLITELLQLTLHLLGQFGIGLGVVVTEQLYVRGERPLTTQEFLALATDALEQ